MELVSVTYALEVRYANGWCRVDDFNSLDEARDAYDLWDHRPDTERRVVRTYKEVVL